MPTSSLEWFTMMPQIFLQLLLVAHGYNTLTVTPQARSLGSVLILLILGNGMSMSNSNPDCMVSTVNRSAVINNASLKAQYYPCGLIANSFFSGKISSLIFRYNW